MQSDKEMQNIKQLLDSAESQIRQAKSLLFSNDISKKAAEVSKSSDGSVIEGVFDGEMMVGPDQKKYFVPQNYASKSKLIPGDILKLTILEDGSYVYKQIGPIERKKIIGEIEEVERGKFVANAEGKTYQLLLASVTYFKAEAGDKVTIIVPKEGESLWAALENLIDKSKE
ncbi:MAG: hypothetical protein AAB881_01695 [Patescibacteria group bacterium]